MQDIEDLFGRHRSKEEFRNIAGKIYRRWEQSDICQSVLADIQRRLPQLLAYTNIPKVPRTTNLIESFNSHLEGRLKTIKGFDSFKHADTWLNAYFIRRRLKPFTDCAGKFRYLNGKRSLEQTIKPNYKIDTVLKLIR